MKDIRGHKLNNVADKWQIIKTKAALLCRGIHPNKVAETIYRRQNPCQDWKTGNVGLHISFESGSHVLVTVAHTFDERSPYSLEYQNGRLVLLKGQEVVNHVREVPMPNWYQKKTTTMIPMSALFLHEGRSFLHQAYSGCDYHSVGLQCEFCGTGSNWQIGKPGEVGEAVDQAVSENHKYHVCLGGGTRLPLNLNVEYFSKCLYEIRERNTKVPVWVEMVPPESDNGILRLVQSGATSFGFNIEIWDDMLRKKICLGKSQIPKSRYLSAMKKVLGLLGPNRVGSCLLVGLEPIESSIEGVIALGSIGIQPCILPFKPWDKSLYSNRPLCDANDLIEVSKAAVNAMIKNGVSAERNEGCLLCEGCTIDHDIYDLFKLQINEERGNKHENSSS